MLSDQGTTPPLSGSTSILLCTQCNRTFKPVSTLAHKCIHSSGREMASLLYTRQLQQISIGFNTQHPNSLWLFLAPATPHSYKSLALFHQLATVNTSYGSFFLVENSQKVASVHRMVSLALPCSSDPSQLQIVGFIRPTSDHSTLHLHEHSFTSPLLAPVKNSFFLHVLRVVCIRPTAQDIFLHTILSLRQ